MSEALHSFDLMLLQLLTPWHAPWLDQLMMSMSAAGRAGMIWLLLGGIGFAWPRHRAATWRVFLTIGLAYFFVDAIAKPLVGRERPPERSELVDARALPPRPTTASFPSGHATSTFAAVVAVSRMWPQGRVVWWTLALLIGYSRVYLGHHYPLDIVGGAVCGVAIAWWVLGGRHRATYASTLPSPMPPGVIVRP